MIGYAPLAGLLLAAPVVLRALTGDVGVEEALAAWLVGMAVAAVGLWVLGQSLRPDPRAAGTPESGTRADFGRGSGAPRRRRGDTPAA